MVNKLLCGGLQQRLDPRLSTRLYIGGVPTVSKAAEILWPAVLHGKKLYVRSVYWLWNAQTVTQCPAALKTF